MTRKGVSALLMGVVLSACATTTPPPRLSPRDPADPAAPEAASPPALPVLMVDEDRAPEAKQEQLVPEAPAHREHHMPSAPASPPPTSGVEYTCPMHPAVMQDKPGSCPVCGMTLVKKASPSPEEGHKP